MKVLDEFYGAKVLSGKEITAYLTAIGWKTIIDKVAETFTEEAKKKVFSPPKVVISLPKYNNDFRMMPSYMFKYPEFCGTKIISACTDNPAKHNLPLAMGTYLLNDAETQKPLMMFDATIPTAFRTAAATAVAVRELASKNARTLGIIGCGQQADYHIPAICAVRNIEEIYVNDLNEDSMDKLVNRFGEEYIISKEKKDFILKTSDIIVTLTPTTEPHIFIKDLPDNKDMLLCAVGGDAERKIEFEPAILNVVDHFCDSRAQAAHTGLVHRAIWEEIIVEGYLRSLGDYMIGKAKLYDSKRIKMFLSTGVALQDLVVAILLYDLVK